MILHSYKLTTVYLNMENANSANDSNVLADDLLDNLLDDNLLYYPMRL